jgi:hypothetical protein
VALLDQVAVAGFQEIELGDHPEQAGPVPALDDRVPSGSMLTCTFPRQSTDDNIDLRCINDKSGLTS